MKARTCVWVCMVFVLFSVTVCRKGAHGLRMEAYRDPLAIELVTQGLHRPAGLAVHPTSGLLHVAEKANRRIVSIHDRIPVTVLDTGFQVDEEIPFWAVCDLRPHEDWVHAGLRDPTDIAFDDTGRLWVAESGMRGRLLRFHAIEDQFVLADVIASPWLNAGMGYTSVRVAPDQRVYTVMQAADDPGMLTMGRVAMREPNGEWFLIDYSPFAEFSNLHLSPDGETLVFAESRTADVAWYDTRRQVIYGAMERVRGVRHITLLPDGTTLVSVEREDETWSIVELDPRHGRAWEWVGGLTRVGGLTSHPEANTVYISLEDEGRVMRVYRLGDRRVAPDNRLEGLMQTFEMENSLPPREWPAFFREFIERLGMLEAKDEVMSSMNPMTSGKRQMSVEEFTSAIPVVAAKLKATLLSPPELEPDPITDISFVIFFPNQTVHTRQSVAPSVSLFRAEHRSGRVTRTRFLPTGSGAPVSEDMDWDNLPEVLVSIPAGYHAEQTRLTDEGLVRAYFLGMGLGPDFWLDIYRGEPNRSVMRVEHRNGTRIDYAIEAFPEQPDAGGETILVAGLKDLEMGWLSIGNRPVSWNIARDDSPALNVRNMERMERQGWRNVDQPLTRASERQPHLHREDITFRRAVVLRAATRWPDVYF